VRLYADANNDGADGAADKPLQQLQTVVIHSQAPGNYIVALHPAGWRSSKCPPTVVILINTDNDNNGTQQCAGEVRSKITLL
jgi:hypothetical protein